MSDLVENRPVSGGASRAGRDGAVMRARDVALRSGMALGLLIAILSASGCYEGTLGSSNLRSTSMIVATDSGRLPEDSRASLAYAPP